MGEAVREPEFSHSYGGEDYFVFPFRCLRLSGAEDVVNVIVSRNTVDQFDIRAGQRLAIRGEVRSYNNRSGMGNKLVITVHAGTSRASPGLSRTSTEWRWWVICAENRCIAAHRWGERLRTCSWL